MPIGMENWQVNDQEELDRNETREEDEDDNETEVNKLMNPIFLSDTHESSLVSCSENSPGRIKDGTLAYEISCFTILPVLVRILKNNSSSGSVSSYGFSSFLPLFYVVGEQRVLRA